MIFFTGDLHLFHENIISLCNRPHKNKIEMNEDIISKNNEIVSDNDDVWDVGDFAFKCSPVDVVSCLKRLKGRRHIIMGNHDKPLLQAYKKGLIDLLIKNNKVEIIGIESIICDKTISISKMLTIDNHKVFLSHYSCRSWPGAFRGSMMLYGHSHGNLTEPFHKSFDVGVDSNNFYPWRWEDVKARMYNINRPFVEN